MAKNPLEVISLGEVPVECTTFKNTAVIVPMQESGPIRVWDLRTDRFQTMGTFTDLDL